VYISLTSTSQLRQVSFYLDDPNRTRPARQIEMLTPYDFAGGEPGAANPFFLTTALRGEHIVTAVVVRSNGVTVVNSARFTVG
jgi:hypothetical protein